MDSIPKTDLVKFYKNGLETASQLEELPHYREGIEITLRALAEKFDLKEAS